MDIRPIRTEADYQAALKAVAPFFDEEPIAGSDDADRFEVLLALIQLFEAKNYPIDSITEPAPATEQPAPGSSS